MDDEIAIMTESEDDIYDLIVRLQELRSRESIIKRKVNNVKKKINEFLDEHEISRVENCTHILTRTVVSREVLLNKEEFQAKYGEKWIKENCKHTGITRLGVKEK